MKSKTHNRKLSFLFVTADRYPPFRVDLTVLFGKELAGNGHKIDLLMQSEDTCKSSFETTWSNCRVWVAASDSKNGKRNRLRKHLMRIGHAFKIFRLVKRNHYDFVQVKDLFLIAIVAFVAAKLCRKKIFYWLSYPFPEASLLDAKLGIARYPIFYRIRGIFFKYLLYHFIMPYFDHVFVQSAQMKRDILKYYGDESKITPVPMGILPEMFLNLEKDSDLDINFRKPTIVYLGTLLKHRRPSFILEVFARVKNEIQNAQLVIIGKGDTADDLDDLKALSKKMKLDKAILFTGFIERYKAFTIIRNADVCLSPYYPSKVLMSTSPTKILEYMAIGKPVVANIHPEQTEIIKASNGGLCVNYTPEAFAEAVTYLLNHKKIAQHMGMMGQKYVLKHRSYTTISQMVENEYQRIISNNR